MAPGDKMPIEGVKSQPNGLNLPLALRFLKILGMIEIAQ